MSKASFESVHQSPLHLAAANRREEAVQILGREETTLNEKDGRVQSALHMAICRGQGVVVKALISLGPDMESRDMFDVTLLEAAFLSDHPIMAYILGRCHRRHHSGVCSVMLSIGSDVVSCSASAGSMAGSSLATEPSGDGCGD